jgi:hypothetical protein
MLTSLILVHLVHGKEPHQLKVQSNRPRAGANPEVLVF